MWPGLFRVRTSMRKGFCYTRPNRPWCLPNPLHNVRRVCLLVVYCPVRGVEPPPLFTPFVNMDGSVPLFPLCASNCMLSRDLYPCDSCYKSFYEAILWWHKELWTVVLYMSWVLLRRKLSWIRFKDSALTARKIVSSVLQMNQWKLYRKIIVVLKSVKHINTLCGQNVDWG